MTPRELIHAKGGPAKMEADLKPFAASADREIKQGAISVAGNRNRLPRAWWPELQQAYPDLTVEKLKEIEAAGEAAQPERGAA